MTNVARYGGPKPPPGDGRETWRGTGALERLRSLRGAREDYTGPWLPEPLVTAEYPVTAAENVTTGLLVVLETPPRYPVEPRVARVVAERFVAAMAGGSVADLLAVLSPDVTLWNDGSGRVRASLRPIYGADRVPARRVVGLPRRRLRTRVVTARTP